MVNSAITAFQLFGIGVTLGLGTQCLFACAPILLSYVAAVEYDWKRAFWDVVLLIGGRLVAYVVLGALVGMSVSYIERAASSGAVAVIRAFSGGVVILLGIVTALGVGFKIESCARFARQGLSKSGLFAAGLAIGFAPCLPLISVLSEISLISKSPLSGAVYALFFGLGTAAASLITIGPLAGLLGHLPSKVLKSEAVQRVFRVVAGALLVLFGIIFFSGIAKAAETQGEKPLYVKRVVDGDTLQLSDGAKV